MFGSGTRKYLVCALGLLSGMVAKSPAQTFRQLYRFGLPSELSGNSRIGFDQAGRVSWAAVQQGVIRNAQFTLATVNPLVYQKGIFGEQVTGFYNLNDGSMILAATTKNVQGVEVTSLTQFPADGQAVRSILLSGTAKTALDPAGYLGSC